MKEIRVYSVNACDMPEEYSSVNDEVFIKIAEENGNVWSLSGFEKSFNEGKQYPSPETNFIRFIEV